MLMLYSIKVDYSAFQESHAQLLELIKTHGSAGALPKAGPLATSGIVVTHHHQVYNSEGNHQAAGGFGAGAGAARAGVSAGLSVSGLRQ